MKKEKIFQSLNNLLHSIGFDLRRFPFRHERALVRYLISNSVEHCIDAGANIGQYATQLRSTGYKGQIISFEPQKRAFEQLLKKANATANWKAVNAGLGSEDGNAVLNISENSVSSSIFDMSETLANAAAEVAYVGTEEIKICRLDTFINQQLPGKKIFLKIDAQGYESKILEGLGKCFEQVYALQLETAFVTLYKGELLFDELRKTIEEKGFYLSSIEGGFTDEASGRLLQADVIFLRNKAVD
jgi:FkbM family methyltransferase